MHSISFHSVYELIGVAVRSTDAWKVFVTVATVKLKATMASLIAYTTTAKVYIIHHVVLCRDMTICHDMRFISENLARKSQKSQVTHWLSMLVFGSYEYM